MAREYRQRFWTRDGYPTVHCVDVFTMGDCWALAAELSRQSKADPDLTDLEIYLVGGGLHWVAGVPGADQFLDITGLNTRYEVLRNWRSDSLRRAPEAEVRWALTSAYHPKRFTFGYALDRRRLVDAARRVLEAHSSVLG